ncbi:hypothetical protein HY251_01400 [bacterium]|nr:hypothetical protein [bacterium]
MGNEKRQLIFYEEDVAAVRKAFAPYQAAVRTKANLLMDVQGHAFAQIGEPGIPPETISALVTASFAATRPVSEVITQDEFVTLTHEGKHASVQLTLLPEGAVLVTVFEPKATTVGALTFYLKDLRDRLVAIVKTVSERKGKPVDLGTGFDDAAKGALDDVFGDMGAEEEQKS